MTKTLKEFLKKHEACEDGYMFAKDLTLEQFLNTCERGDWILWLFQRSNPRNKKLKVLTAAHCANTVRHLMKDERSINAVDVAIKYGEGKASEAELRAAADAAAAAYADAYAAAAAAYAAAYDASAASAADADTDAYAAYDAADAAAAAYAAAYDAADADAAAAYDAAAASYDAADAVAYARKKNQLETANICRQYLPIDLWKIK